MCGHAVLVLFVGSGGERRLSQPALLHEQNVEDRPQQEECQDDEQELEKRLIYQILVQAHVAVSILMNVSTQVAAVHYNGQSVDKQL